MAVSTGRPRRVVIVGGSISGLFHGVYLKRHGSDVVILEQDPKTIRSSHNAGIAIGPAALEFLAKYDDTGVQSCIPGVRTRLAYRQNLYWKDTNITKHLTSWGLLYRILRANFDGLTSEAVPQPPKPRESDGKAEYRAGKRATGLWYHDGVVTVQFVGEDGKEDRITADLVLGADGLHSTVKTLLAQATAKEYSGYVSWRGTINESELSPKTAEYFANRTVLGFYERNYFVCYPIPPDSGSFAPGTRLINWVWYWNMDESYELDQVLTDIHGYKHSNTVPSGLINPEIWKKHLANTVPSLSPTFAELLLKTENPFVTKVNDAICERATYHDGHVILVGDALSTFRPHFALATEQAAKHCLALGKVWDGETTLEQWEKEAIIWATKIRLGSRTMGAGHVRGWGEFFGAAWESLVFMVRAQLGWA
ncbi:hypothetical protein QBC35DRAFT_21179 [Podospora australis]|uniref:2,6-dihydroxypyridine 3-monooxygenase substrate binding domain-containing protein n=1 Tax=Podospora australis TaxID=1536484 RepID=A0AAN6WNV3_9PEZI|nr:hypothetical protein QBC35DRAFT_21179 [Podospora australis]